MGNQKSQDEATFGPNTFNSDQLEGTITKNTTGDSKTGEIGITIHPQNREPTTIDPHFTLKFEDGELLEGDSIRQLLIWLQLNDPINEALEA